MLPHYKQNSQGRWITYCLCDCDCGTSDVAIMASKIKSGHTCSCGCLRRERATDALRKRCVTHGKSNTRAYNIWLSIKNRCLLPTSRAYKYYGERGISICDEWRDDFSVFYEWLLNNGYHEPEDDSRNTLFTVDRIDIDGNYEPSNCRLVSMTEQANNKRNNRYETYNGETHTIAEWARMRGMPYKSFCNRLYRGWSFERIMTT